MRIKDVIAKLKELEEGHGNLEVKVLEDTGWKRWYNNVDNVWLGCDYDKDKNPMQYYVVME